MIQTRASALIRLEFLTRFIPELKLDTQLYDSALEEAGKLKRWLNRYSPYIRPHTGNVTQMEAVLPLM